MLDELRDLWWFLRAKLNGWSVTPAPMRYLQGSCVMEFLHYRNGVVVVLVKVSEEAANDYDLAVKETATFVKRVEYGEPKAMMEVFRAYTAGDFADPNV